MFDFSTTPAAKKCVVTYCVAGWSQVRGVAARPAAPSAHNQRLWVCSGLAAKALRQRNAPALPSTSLTLLCAHQGHHKVALCPSDALKETLAKRFSTVTCTHVYGVSHTADVTCFADADAVQTSSFLHADEALGNCVRDNRHSGVLLPGGPAPRRVTAGSGNVRPAKPAAPPAAAPAEAPEQAAAKGNQAPVQETGGRAQQAVAPVAPAPAAAAGGKNSGKGAGGASGGGNKSAIAGMFAAAVPRAKPAAAAPKASPDHRAAAVPDTSPAGGKGTVRSTGRKAAPRRVVIDDDSDDDVEEEAPAALPRFVAPPPVVEADADVAMEDDDDDDARVAGPPGGQPQAKAPSPAPRQQPAAAAPTAGGVKSKRRKVTVTVEDPETGEERTEVQWVMDDEAVPGQEAAAEEEVEAAPKPPSGKKAAPPPAKGGKGAKAPAKGQMGMGAFFGKK